MKETVIVTYPHPDEQTDQSESAGKFLQLVLRGREYLIFAPFELHRYHNQILAHFLEEKNIPHRWTGKEKLEINDSGLEVVGGGRFHSDAGRKTLDLWDDSQVYGRFDERGLPEKIARAGHAWSNCKINIS